MADSSSSDEGLALAPEHEAPGPSDVPAMPGAMAAPVPPPLALSSSDSGDDPVAVPPAEPRIMSATRYFRLHVPGPLHLEDSSSATPSGRSSGHRTASSTDDQDPAHPQQEVLSVRPIFGTGPTADHRRRCVDVSTYPPVFLHVGCTFNGLLWMR
jgi:hypothetical protein